MRRKIRSLLFVAILLVAANNANAFKVVGYLEPWYPNVEDSLLYTYLTHINYSFLIPTASGGITPDWSNTTQLDDLVTRAHAAGKKVLVSVGGWNGGDDSAFHTIAASSSLRTTFITNLYNYVIAHNLDGVDIDWEFPGGAESNFVTLMGELSARMKPAGKLLTAAVYFNGDTQGSISGAYPYVDYFTIMAYNMGTPHSTEAGAQAALNYWANQGMPKEKRILGIPFYGSGSSMSVIAYSDIVADCPTAPEMNQNGSEACNGQYFNGRQTVKDKTAMASTYGDGVSIWELAYDTSDSTTSLLKAIGDVLPASTGIPPQGKTPSSPKLISIQ